MFVTYSKAHDRLGLNGVRRVDGSQFCDKNSYDVAQKTEVHLKQRNTYARINTRTARTLSN